MTTISYAQLGVKGLKTHATRDGGSFNYKLTIDGKVVGEVLNEGHGGSTDLRLVKGSEGLLPALEALGKSRPSTVLDIKPDLGMMLCELLDDAETLKRVKRLAKTKTLFSLPTDAKGEFRSFSRPFSSEVKAVILKKHPDATILNESL